MTTGKMCTGCKTTKLLSEFWPDRRTGRAASRCKSCKAEYAKRWRAANPHKQLERYWNNPDRERERHLVRKYGVDLAAYQRMFTSQGGKCAICGKAQERAFDVDHDHATGVVRGLLCTNCNRMVGHAADDPVRLRAAAVYLESVPQVAQAFIEAVMEAA
jgi:hypothetical protein